MEIHRIVVPTDFSDTARKALDQALILAARYQAEVTVVHARVLYEDDATRLPEGLNRVHQEEDKIEEEILRSLRDGTKKQAELKIKHEIIRGYSAPSAILGYLNNHPCQLVVIGTHGRSGLEHFLIGSVAEKVVRYAPCPVLTLHRESRVKHTFKRIVVPYDFSDDSHSALQTAFDWVEEEGSIDLLYVINQDVHPALYSWGMKSLKEIVPDIVKKAEEKLDETVAELASKKKITVNRIISEGTPHKEISKYAMETPIDLVLMATHGLVGLDRFLLGSTSERVIRSVHRPILILKRENLI